MFDPISVFKEHRIRYWTEGKNCAPGWIQTRCPFCKDHSNHLGWSLNEEDPIVRCWKCGRHWILEALSKTLECSISVAQGIIESHQGGRKIPLIQKKRPQASSLHPPGKELSRFHREYLVSRGFNPDSLIENYGILGTGPNEYWEKSDFSLRIIIPIYLEGKLISFQGRDITDKQKERYKGCPVEKSVLPYKSSFYGIDEVWGKPSVCIVEGIFDKWKLGKGFVASYGTELTKAQIQKLIKFKTVHFLFDPEPAAQKKAMGYAKTLSAFGVDVRVWNEPGAEDPGAMSEEQVQIIRKELNL